MDLEGHEAPTDRGGGRTPPRARRSGPVEADSSLIPETRGRVDSGTDNAGIPEALRPVR
jgi:hypothetical protein